jgi:pyruvate dehydrogenase E1 component beta subunit
LLPGEGLNLALCDEMDRDPAVCVLGEDIGAGIAGLTPGLRK